MQTTLYDLLESIKPQLNSSLYKIRYQEVFKNIILAEISPELLMQARIYRNPGFVLKIHDKLYYTSEIRYKNLLWPNLIMGSHLCSALCSHMSPAEDSEGGCAKVRDFFVNPNIIRNFSNSKRCLKLFTKSKRIEKYDFISIGFEVFNTIDYDCFAVLCCTKHSKI